MKLALSTPAKASVQAPYTARARCLSAGTQRAATRPQLPVAARRQRCRAMAEKEGKQLQQEGQPQVPDTPPTPSAATQERLPAAQPSSQQTEQPASIEEIQQRAAQMRQDKAAASAKGGLVEGVREEVMLIKWPAPLKAVLNTFLVIGIVAGTSAVLLGINSVLTEISNAIY